MRATWPLWLFSAIALVGLVILGFIVVSGSVRLCGRMSGCVTYRLAESPGHFLLASFPAVLLLVGGSCGAWWWHRLTGRR